ncbi:MULTISPECIES: ABC transporter substrate-binding protein [Bosea]|uniref:ABC transporter substrate-binding protein n=1 Tax=Bosea TaxID=85413 RepID=UPI00214F9109|nr:MULTISPECIES: ABC transporter substrate-binding protein [Bosea]MCR4524227.1 ABC transporter substrate-binding protein [Bosea sp. 47.2.35]MDR6831169.1 peptide/nickel transport system substrate-binding protein [Bosea robiniae]MDR6897909.1 peptide/nickel transport system substrate-binding protein [Bosea sp. BE109]MDR7141332.1 peptide/nickel transport system substrate-binding protein [Bosea sp. BE168]MDR7177994.1 peptide/nickel transport system substrate-binding protein [Bosea sp. BE271]
MTQRRHDPTRRTALLLGSAALAGASLPRLAQAAPTPFSGTAIDSPFLKDRVAAGALPPVAARLPANPRVIDLEALGRQQGRHGGNIRMLMGDQRDIRMMTLYGYTRLMVYDDNLDLVPDVLESCEVEDGRIFTLRLRQGHRWSDGSPLTTEDFRYWWEDIANNKRLSPGGPPQALFSAGEPPRFEILSETEVRYSWKAPNPVFLPALAGAQPTYIFMPSGYLKQFHERHAPKHELAQRVKEHRVRDWGALHERLSRMYRPENPKLPTLEPWRNTTPLPAEQFVFERNPYFHRVDRNGRQLPYADQVTLTIGTSALVPAKTAAGEADLQARYLRFDNYTFLKEASKRMNFDVRLWKRAEGAYFALLPNLNAIDPVWRDLNRDIRYRRAISVAINRQDVNKVIFFGLAKESGNTALPESPLYDPRFTSLWTQHDPALANRLLDEIGLTKRDDDGIRLLQDGRRLEFTIETAGENTEETDILDLLKQDFFDVGIKIYPRSTQRDVFRRRILAGQTVMSAWAGMDNALVTSDMEPDALAPTSSAQFQWPRWGQFVESNGKEGERPALPAANKLVRLYEEWRMSSTRDQRRAIWREMLALNAEELFTIGVINSTLQPIVVSRDLRNVPEKGLYSFEPGAFIGRYMPDTFWFDRPETKA